MSKKVKWVPVGGLPIKLSFEPLQLDREGASWLPAKIQLKDGGLKFMALKNPTREQTKAYLASIPPLEEGDIPTLYGGIVNGVHYVAATKDVNPDSFYVGIGAGDDEKARLFDLPDDESVDIWFDSNFTEDGGT